MDNKTDKYQILERMEEFLTSQLESYRDILNLSNAQIELIDTNNTAELMKVLAKKQETIRVVDRISKDAEGVRVEWENIRQEFNDNEKTRLESVHNELKEILSEIMALEENGRAHLSHKMGDAGGKITKMQKGKQMLKAYGAGVPKKSNYTDNNG